jgi:hypothetical protein
MSSECLVEISSPALHTAFPDKPERNCHFLISGRKCMTHLQASKYFNDTSQVSLNKNNKINSLFLRGVENEAPVAVYFLFFNSRPA